MPNKKRQRIDASQIIDSLSGNVTTAGEDKEELLLVLKAHFTPSTIRYDAGENKLIFIVSDDFKKRRVQPVLLSHRSMILSVIQRILEITTTMDKTSIVVESNPESSDFKSQQESLDLLASSAVNPSKPKKKREGNGTFWIGDDYTFDNFVPGIIEDNLFSFVAAKQVANDPGCRKHNPLFIYGDPGLGKTHLMHAIGYALQMQHPDEYIVACSAEEFTNQFIDAAKTGKSSPQKMSQFMKDYRKCFALLMDEVDFLANKSATSEAFLHTFNSLYEGGKQIVAVSCQSPEELSKKFTKPLSNRLFSGLIAEIKKPQLQTRMEILTQKATSMGLEVDPVVLKFYAENIFDSVRSLESCLSVTETLMMISGVFDLEKAQDVVKRYPNRETTRDITASLILETVIHHYNVTLGDLRGKSRASDVAHPRHVAMYLMRKYLNKSYKEIAIKFERKDHATVHHAVKKISGYIDNDPAIRREIEFIEGKLGIKT